MNKETIQEETNFSSPLGARGSIEIMAPAGSWESLSAAIKAGADSVYFGIEKLNMRSKSSSNLPPMTYAKSFVSATKIR